MTFLYDKNISQYIYNKFVPVFNDYNIKMRNVQKILDNGDKVKFTIRFRGRELAHQNRGMMVLNRVKDDLGDTIKVENMPKMEGRQMIMVLAPK